MAMTIAVSFDNNLHVSDIIKCKHHLCILHKTAIRLSTMTKLDDYVT